MLDHIKILYHQGKQYIPDVTKAKVPGIFRGRPIISMAKVDESELVNLCPLNAISVNPLLLDLGKCTFCGECARRFPEKIEFTTDYKIAANDRDSLIIKEGVNEPVSINPANVRKEVHDLMSSLLEYSQRKEMAEISKKKVDVTYGDKKGEFFIFKELVFFVPDFTSEKIKKIHSDGKVEEVEREEIKEYLSNHNSEKKINTKWINILKKVIGEFEINL